MIFKIILSGNLQLEYFIYQEEISNFWVNLISSVTKEDLCLINHKVGFESENYVIEKINRIYYLADLINNEVPDRVIKLEILKENWKIALHKMHIHFPDLKNDEKYKHIWNALTEYNDILHWLESTLPNIWETDNNLTPSSKFRLTLDFNKSKKIKFLNIPESAYKLFDPFSNFGGLYLHYTHVGKHPQEIYFTNDYECPKYQLVPQRTFSASVRLAFNDNKFVLNNKQKDYLNDWYKFYNLRGGSEFWGYNLDDPKLSFGYIKIGQLNKIIQNNSELSFPISLNDRHDFRKLLVTCNVLAWTIEEGPKPQS